MKCEEYLCQITSSYIGAIEIQITFALKMVGEIKEVSSAAIWFLFSGIGRESRLDKEKN